MFQGGRKGAGHYSAGKKVELYRVALGSAHESNSILAVLENDMPSSKLIPDAQDLCDSIRAQLTNLIRSIEERGET